MLDAALSALIRKPVEVLARSLVGLGARADGISLLGFGVGIGGACAIALGWPLWGLLGVLFSRLLDGLDGAVARLTTPTDRGAFLDITLDFLFYASIPLAFALANPPSNALPAAVLLAAFMGTGASFLAFAVLAERRGLKSTAYPRKGLYYLGGLTEASETLICFALMCLWPAQFAWWAYGFAVLCALTIAGRLVAGWQAFRV
jgi:phosphatidylglycerophosphate synthase